MRRLKRRYLGLQLDIDNAPSERDFMEAVWGSVTRIYGEFGASLTNLALISYDPKAKIAVIRSNLVAVDSVRAALTTITSLTGKAAAVHVLAVSGTIKALNQNLRS